MASSDSCIITVRGKGGHGAMPQAAVDPVVAASSIVMALQTIVSRNLAPLEMGVVTVGAFHAGDAPNVIPGEATLKLTVRAFKPTVRDLLEQRITEIAQTQAAVYGANAQVQYQRRYPMLYNNPEQTAFCERVVRDWMGDGGPGRQRRAGDRQRGLRVLPRKGAGLLCLHRQWCRRPRRLHGAQPGV